MDNLGLSLIKETTWNEVFADWKAREADHWGWEAHWKERGFDSWEAWRASYTGGKLDLPHRDWAVFRVKDPYWLIPQTWAGAYKGWQKYYPEETRSVRFHELVKNPAVARNKKVASMVKAFPIPTTMIGIRWDGEMVIFEGMHRASAISLLAQKKDRPKLDLSMAVVTLAPEERALFQSLYKQKPR